MMIPCLKVVAPSTPVDVVGLMAAAIRDPDPVVFFEHKALFGTKGEVPEGEVIDCLGVARLVRGGGPCWAPVPPRPPPRPPLGEKDEPPVHGRGDPPPLWLGRRGGLHRRRG